MSAFVPEGDDLMLAPDEQIVSGQEDSDSELVPLSLLKNRSPDSLRQWSKACLTTIHLVAPERKALIWYLTLLEIES